MDLALEEACRSLPNGGDHQTRRAIAQRLIACASGGAASIEQLRVVAYHAVREITVCVGSRFLR